MRPKTRTNKAGQVHVLTTFCRHPFMNERGMALVLTLLAVALITAMVVEFAYGVYVSTNELYNWHNSQKLSLAAKSAVKLGARLITENASMNSYTPALFELSDKIPAGDLEGTFSIRIVDEQGKFNLNSLVYPNGKLNDNSYASFLRLLRAAGLREDIAERIVDWIDPDSEPRARDSETDTKNGSLDSIDELLLIPGMEREKYDTLLPYVTIYGSGLINLNSAGIPVLMSLSISRDMAERVMRFREITPFEKTQDIFKVAGFDKIGTDLMGHVSVKGTVFQVTATASAAGMKKIIECVIDAGGSRRIVRYWKEL